MALKRCGALWLKEKNGKKFFSGVIEPEGRGGPKYSILIFRNEKRPDHPKDPDYSIQLADNGGQQGGSGDGQRDRPF
jgi:hypothetical protein